VGGDCTNVGCIPSKTLLDLAGPAARGGLAPGSDGLGAPPPDALAEVRRRRDALRDHETAMLAAEPRLTLSAAAAGSPPPARRGRRRRRPAPAAVRTVVLATGARPRRSTCRGCPRSGR
jgi:dihydrolipoamide dehydrogenase